MSDNELDEESVREQNTLSFDGFTTALEMEKKKKQNGPTSAIKIHTNSLVSDPSSSRQGQLNGFQTALELNIQNKYKSQSEESTAQISESENSKSYEKSSVTNGFKTALEVSKSNQFKSASETMKSNQSDRRAKSKKKPESRSITDFFKGNSSKATTVQNPENSNELPSKDHTEFRHYEEVPEQLGNNMADEKIITLENDEILSTKNTEENSNKRSNTFKPKFPSKKKVSSTNAILFGEESASDEDCDINQAAEGAVSSSSRIENKNNDKCNITSGDKKSPRSKPPNVEKISKRSHSEIESTSSDHNVKNEKRQRLNNEECKTTKDKSPESIKIRRKTFDILRPIVMKYFISPYIPDSNKFKVIFRKIHEYILDRKIYGNFKTFKSNIFIE